MTEESRHEDWCRYWNDGHCTCGPHVVDGLTEDAIKSLAAEFIAADWEPADYYRDLNLIGFARALLSKVNATTAPSGSAQVS